MATVKENGQVPPATLPGPLAPASRAVLTFWPRRRPARRPPAPRTTGLFRPAWDV